MRLCRLYEEVSLDKRLGMLSPSLSEVGWIGDKRFFGDSKSVEAKFEVPPDCSGEFFDHTHPCSKDSPSSFLGVLPSEEDLDSTIKVCNVGMSGIRIFQGGGDQDKYYMIINSGKLSKLPNISVYLNKAKGGNYEEAIRELIRLGFVVDYGVK